MGLDITIREYKGLNDKGYLIMKSPEIDLPYTTDRMSIRHEISKNVEFKVLNSGKKYDLEEYYRPESMEDAYKWCNKLEDKDRSYVLRLLDSLNINENYWLEYSY